MGGVRKRHIQMEFIHFRIYLIAIITTDTEKDSLSICTHNKWKRRQWQNVPVEPACFLWVALRRYRSVDHFWATSGVKNTFPRTGFLILIRCAMPPSKGSLMQLTRFSPQYTIGCFIFALFGSDTDQRISLHSSFWMTQSGGGQDSSVSSPGRMSVQLSASTPGCRWDTTERLFIMRLRSKTNQLPRCRCPTRQNWQRRL